MLLYFVNSFRTDPAICFLCYDFLIYVWIAIFANITTQIQIYGCNNNEFCKILFYAGLRGADRYLCLVNLPNGYIEKIR